MKKRIWFAVFIFSFILTMIGCSAAQDLYTSSYLTDKIQKELDKAEAQKKNQVEVDKILAADPNMTDKKKIDQALADFNRLDTQIIPTYEKAIQQVQINVKTIQNDLVKIKTQEVKTLGENTITSFQKMLDAELAYIAFAKTSSDMQKEYFTILQKGHEPTGDAIDKINKDIEKASNATNALNASIDIFNTNWQKLVEKAGQELQK